MKTKIQHTAFPVLLYSFLLTIAFSACTKDNTFPGKNASSISSAIANESANSPAMQAIVTDQHFDFPGPIDLINQCTGESVTVNGTIGDDMHVVINGNNVNFSEHQQAQLNGTGSLGNTYVTNLNENVTLNGTLSDGHFIIEDVTIFRMISTNGTANFKVRRNAHLTVNANGIVTVDRIDFTIICPK